MGDTLRLDASFVDYGLVVVYFAGVLLIGLWSRIRPIVVEEPARSERDS